jgi:PDZ domain-containing protein
MRGRLPGALATLGVVLLVVVGALWLGHSSDYLISPDRAKPLVGRVTVQGERSGGPGGIYYVDVLVRRATLLERLVAPLRPDGSELVPRDRLFTPGTSDSDRVRQGQRQMERSEQVAAAVALRAAGYEVKAKPDGVTVDAVAGDVPATGKLKPTDVIVSADGRPVRTPSDLRRVVGTRAPGKTVTLGLREGKTVRQVTVGTVASSADPKRTVIGIAVSQAAEIELPIKVSIDLGDVGGPSAGLAFALDVLEELGRNVDRGYRVAATGELELDGTVAPIGGAAQKALGARRTGVDVLLVPAGDNAREARSSADGLRIIPVDSFQQALRALATLPRKT